ncbi:hypothetical protein MUK42_16356 [Musa troglodytarum]|uniref:Uncharacterized protein n=1 Tax=Musa troglodytarum TaxID=320322 RepID=A0A9E7ENP2_9LILI|nr:hypothetical protein MUK42_16356 [Musa troglodytarum]
MVAVGLERRGQHTMNPWPGFMLHCVLFPGISFRSLLRCLSGLMVKRRSRCCRLLGFHEKKQRSGVESTVDFVVVLVPDDDALVTRTSNSRPPLLNSTQHMPPVTVSCCDLRTAQRSAQERR